MTKREFSNNFNTIQMHCHLPPLRKRKGDLSTLANIRLIAQGNQDAGCNIKKFLLMQKILLRTTLARKCTGIAVRLAALSTPVSGRY